MTDIPHHSAGAPTDPAKRRLYMRQILPLRGAPDCPICRGTGIAHSAPYIPALGLYTMTACKCAQMEGKPHE
jgi:hypothetical protein